VTPLADARVQRQGLSAASHPRRSNVTIVKPRYCLVLGVMTATIAVATHPSALAAQLISRAGAGGTVAAVGAGWQPQIALDGEIVSPAVASLRTSVNGSYARASGMDAPFATELVSGLRLSSLLPRGGVWLGADLVRRTGVGDFVERPRLTAGTWRRIGELVLTVSASRRGTRYSSMSYSDRIVHQQPLIRDTLGKIDTIPLPDIVTRDSTRRAATQQWAETEATLFWERRRWSASVAIGGRFASRGVPGSVWSSGDVAFAFTPALSLVLGGGVSPATHYIVPSEHRYAMLGLRVAPRFFRSRAVPVPSAPVAASFMVEPETPGRYLVTVRVPGARQVELSGDFTGWKPISLRRVRGDDWSVALPLEVGTHRVNIRVDGGAWVAPPGMTTTSDDFAGEVGLLVVEASARRA
jgi:AMP-activated protein kinase-like protein